jgi:hypothetical protein
MKERLSCKVLNFLLLRTLTNHKIILYFMILMKRIENNEDKELVERIYLYYDGFD